jgi:hypothetical protein
MATNATNGCKSTEYGLVVEGNMDEPINIEQSGEIRQDGGLEQVLDKNTKSSHVGSDI